MKFKNLTQKNFILKILEQFVKTNPFLYKFAMILNSHILRNFFPESDFTGLKYINFPKKKNCIDIGANLGQSVDFFLKHFQKIHAFEPYKKNINILKKKFNNNPRVVIYNYALDEDEKIKTLYVPYYKNIISLHNFASFYKNVALKQLFDIIKIKKKFINFKTFQVKCKRLDSFSIRNISFIKIDVEGKESGILNGMTKILKNDIIFLIERTEPDFKRVKKIMKKNNFKPHVFDFKNKKFTEHNIEKEVNIYFAKVNNSLLVSK